MKKIIKIAFALIICVISMSVKAQIYDGITQPTQNRIWLALSQPTNGTGDAAFNPFVGYRYDFCKFFNVTGIAQYNFNKKAFSPALWLNFSIKDRVYILSRNIYDCQSEKYKQTLSASVKIPKGFMVDATWDNMYDGSEFIDSDRLQIVGGWGNKKVIFNAGYSVRNKKGLVANIRYKITDAYWAQVKIDGGAESVAFNIAYHF